MGVRKRDNRWWVDFSFNQTRYRRRSPENSRAGALAYELVMKQRLARGEPVDGPIEARPTFRSFSVDWFQTYVKSNNKHSEIQSKEKILRNHLLPFFGEMRLDTVTNLDVEKFKSRKLAENLNPKTINNQLTVLRRCLHSAVEWGIIQGCPLVRRLKTPPRKFDFLTREEARRLISSSDGIMRDMIIVALETGMRFGELIGLSWEDVDLTKRELIIRQAFAHGVLGSTKSNRIRRMPMTPAVHGVLITKRRDTGFVFSSSNGKPLVQSTCGSQLRRICKRAGLRRIGWHVLRHTFASHLAQAGANLVAVQSLLGHSDIHTTMRYAHINDRQLREAIDSLGKNQNNVNTKKPVTIASQPVIPALVKAG